MLEGSPARLELAKALAALGRALRRRGGPPTRASRCAGRWSWRARAGPTALVEQARTELHATGARPRARRRRAAPEALTPSERRVADLAAEGSTNRDIAQALFVTPKTVEVHLTQRLPQARDPLAARARGRSPPPRDRGT